MKIKRKLYIDMDDTQFFLNKRIVQMDSFVPKDNDGRRFSLESQVDQHGRFSR